MAKVVVVTAENTGQVTCSAKLNVQSGNGVENKTFGPGETLGPVTSGTDGKANGHYDTHDSGDATIVTTVQNNSTNGEDITIDAPGQSQVVVAAGSSGAVTTTHRNITVMVNK